MFNINVDSFNTNNALVIQDNDKFMIILLHKRRASPTFPPRRQFTLAPEEMLFDVLVQLKNEQYTEVWLVEADNSLVVYAK